MTMPAGKGAHAASGPMDVLAFWRAAGPQKWFKRDAAFDADVVRLFRDTYQAATAGALASWEQTAVGALALVIVLDQFPRNMFRGEARTFAADPLARAVADRAIARGFDRQCPMAERQFFYLPFMHSENLADQERCVTLCGSLGDENLLQYARQHAGIIRRFGRFPHRNTVLGRPTMPEEQAFLDAGGFAG